MMDRLAINTTLRNYYLFGSSSTIPVKYNKIFPTVDLLSSFLYAQESVKFSVSFGAGVPEEQAVYAETLRKKAHDLWHDTGADRLFSDAVSWALTYNSEFIKVVDNGGIRVYPVHPHFIGVYREDISRLDDQEAIVHLYYTTKSGLRTATKILGPEKQEKILDRVSTLGPIDENMAPQTVTQIIAMGQIPSVKGVVENTYAAQYNYHPQISPELVEMKEVWVYDDELEDYRVFTRANPNVIVFDRPGSKLCTKGEHPFIKVTPYGLPDYFWGLSLVQSLCGLQDWREGITEKLDTTVRKQLRPPRSFTGPGWGSLTDERMLALDKEGGYVSSSVPGAKMEQYPPQLDIGTILNYLHEIDNDFNDTCGLAGNIMRAQGDEGVRSMQHAQVLARMGSSRIKKTVLAVEEGAEKLATLMIRMQQDRDKHKYLDDNKQEFLLSQVTKDFTVKVSGHSLSPVFIEDTKAEAKQLVGMHAMTRKRYLEETEPPMTEELKRDLEQIEAGEAAQQKAQLGIALVKAAGKGR